MTNVISKREIDDPDWSEAKDDTRDTSKKGGAGLPEDYDYAPPLYFGLNYSVETYQLYLSTKD